MGRGLHFLRSVTRRFRRQTHAFGTRSPRRARRLHCEPLEERQLLSITVESLTPTPSGFVVQYSDQIETSTLSLYDAENGALGEADVTLHGASVGDVSGSLVVDGNEMTFVATGGPLAADTYTVTLRSASDAIVDQALGELLDGEYSGAFPSGNGTAGGDFVYSFSVEAPQSLVVSLPDFARGPTQSVEAPAQGSGESLPDGLLVHFSDAEGVTSGKMTITYDPDLLTITDVQLGPDAPTDMLIEANLTVPGEAVIAFAIPGDPLASGAADLIQIIAEVPEDAPYGAAEVLDITELEINAGAVEATADAAIHVVAFPGDANATRNYDTEDARLIARVGVGLDSGFAVDQPTATTSGDPQVLYPTIDAVIIGDVSGKDGLSPLDASDILRCVVGLSTPNLPSLPDEQAPWGIALSDTTVAEGQAVGTVVGTFSTTDPDTGDTHTYTLVTGEGDDDNASFTIDGSQLKTAAVFDLDTQDTYTIRVRTTDQTDRYFEKIFTITLTEANQAPTGLTLTGSSVAENEAAGTVVGQLSTTDPDTGDTHTYSLVSGDGDSGNAAFTIDGNELKTAVAFDFETQDTYSIRVRSTDEGGLYVDEVLTINVTSLAPTATITADAATVNTDPIVFTITFDRDVTGVDVGDLSASGSLDSELTLSNFTAVSATEYTVEVTGMVVDEEVTLTLTASGSGIEDEASNALADDATATVTYVDVKAPIATISPSGTTSNDDPIVFTIAFDEQVTGFDVADLAATGSVTGELAVANLTEVSAAEYTVEVSGMASGESVTLTLTASGSGIQDGASNALADDAAATVTYVDVTAPAATITPDAEAVNTDPITFTIDFGEEVTGVDVTDLSATGSVTGDLTLANFTAVSATQYTVEVSGMESGEEVTLTLTASGSGIEDGASNALAADATAAVAYDATAPTATIASNGTTSNDDPITFTITFDEAVTGLDVTDLAASGSESSTLTLSNLTQLSDTEYTVEVTGMADGEEVTLTLTASGSGIEDAATNALADDATLTVTYVA